MNPKVPVPARLFVLLAREAPVGVILRRGPNQWTQLIRWDTKKDIFTPGQWFRGRVYEERCDISPDGSLLLYFAAKYWRRKDRVWTAVSKIPYYTALNIWFQVDTYGGGGLFEDNNHIWHSTRQESLETLRPSPVSTQNTSATSQITPPTYADNSVYHTRLERDGWQRLSPRLIDKQSSPEWIAQLKQPIIWEKQIKRYTLTMRYLGYKNHHGAIYEYSLTNAKETRLLEQVKWADFDYKGRVVLAKEGKLFTATLNHQGLRLTELADFNPNKPEAIPPPEWAKSW